MHCSVFIATSLDGFIAREDGGLDWLPVPGSTADYGYKAFFDSIDVLVMGSRTFEKVLTFEGEWPYGDKPVVVLTSRALSIPADLSCTVETLSGEPAEIVRKLEARGFRHAYVDGGSTIRGFLEAGLIQRLTITTVPVLLGKGIPLFGPLARDIKLRHISTRSFPDGLVQGTYEVAA